MSTTNDRTADYPIDPMFLHRWSPRAFTAEELPERDLLTMLEAARWAASSYNSQPWRFVYARRDTPHWGRFLDLLVPANQAWAKQASALMILLSNTVMRPPGSDKDVPSPTHSFDAGTASGYFALQAMKMGWHAHGMIGFDRERAFADAVGRLGDPANLPETLRAHKHPNSRLPLTQLAFEGSFGPSPSSDDRPWSDLQGNRHGQVE